MSTVHTLLLAHELAAVHLPSPCTSHLLNICGVRVRPSSNHVLNRCALKTSTYSSLSTELNHTRLFISVDARDLHLGNYQFDGTLSAGATYSKSVRVSIPNAIYGNFSVIVVTDAFNNVYEHASEDDNTGISGVRIYLMTGSVLKCVDYCSVCNIVILRVRQLI